MFLSTKAVLFCNFQLLKTHTTEGNYTFEVDLSRVLGHSQKVMIIMKDCFDIYRK